MRLIKKCWGSFLRWHKRDGNVWFFASLLFLGGGAAFNNGPTLMAGLILALLYGIYKSVVMAITDAGITVVMNVDTVNIGKSFNSNNESTDEQST